MTRETAACHDGVHNCGNDVPEIRCFEDDAGQVALHSVNNTAMHMELTDAFLLNYNYKDPIERMASIKYLAAADVLADRNGSIRWRRRKKKQL
jgi:hypothetical protein